MADLAISYADVVSAAERIVGIAHRTPVLTSSTANARTGARLFFKCENFQRTGAFKIRGAGNAIAQLPADRRAAGVVAFSSGNHAQAIALAAQLQGVKSVIVMPMDAPEIQSRRHPRLWRGGCPLRPLRRSTRNRRQPAGGGTRRNPAAAL